MQDIIQLCKNYTKMRSCFVYAIGVNVKLILPATNNYGITSRREKEEEKQQPLWRFRVAVVSRIFTKSIWNLILNIILVDIYSGVSGGKNGIWNMEILFKKNIIHREDVKLWRVKTVETQHKYFTTWQTAALNIYPVSTLVNETRLRYECQTWTLFPKNRKHKRMKFREWQYRMTLGSRPLHPRQPQLNTHTQKKHINS